MGMLHYEPATPVHAISSRPLPSGELPSVLAFGMVKGGSTLLFDLLRGACDHLDTTFYSADDVLFAEGAVGPRRPLRLDLDFSPVGYCFGGWRQFPHYPVRLLDSAPTVLLIRDVRDMLVSLYYSTAFSHVAPGGDAKEAFLESRERVRAMGIDEFVRTRFHDHLRGIESYYAAGFIHRPNVRIYRYEDVIFAKEAWLADMCRWFGWQLDPSTIAEIVRPFDVVPETADPSSHIRRVTPGSHLDEIDHDSRRRIENLFPHYLRDFYPGTTGGSSPKTVEI